MEVIFKVKISRRGHVLSWLKIVMQMKPEKQKSLPIIIIIFALASGFHDWGIDLNWFSIICYLPKHNIQTNCVEEACKK